MIHVFAVAVHLAAEPHFTGGVTSAGVDFGTLPGLGHADRTDGPCGHRPHSASDHEVSFAVGNSAANRVVKGGLDLVAAVPTVDRAQIDAWRFLVSHPRFEPLAPGGLTLSGPQQPRAPPAA